MLNAILSIILCVAILAGSAAQDVFVSNSFTAAQCTVAERNCPDIGSALNLSTSYSTVYLYAGVYSGTGNANICIGKCIDIKGVTLAGLGDPGDVILAAKDLPFADSVAIYIFENTITQIANLTIQDYSNTVSTEPNKAGAMEVVNSDVSFFNVVFQNNSGVIGGAMHVTNSNVTLNGTKFLRNSARLHGGGLYFINSNVKVDRSLFRHNNVSTVPSNTAGTGGAIYFVGVNDLSITNSQFIGNDAMRSGGALFMQLNSNTGIKSLSGQFSARDSLFKDNSVNGLGNCVYSGTCNSRGGALFINALSTQLVNCVFEGNRALTSSTTEAAQGGGLYASTNALDIISPSVGVTVRNCSFNGNHATGQGGAMFVTGQRLDLLNSLFTSNYVDTVNSYFTDSPAQGGAIFFSSGNVGAVASNVVDCHFVQNSAYSGWGGAFFGTDSLGAMYITGSTFAGNNAYSSYTNTGHGGALMVASNFNLDLSDCAFRNNSALPYLQLVPLTYSGSGGAVFAQTASINVTHCDFTTNYALTGQFDSGSSGGAIMLEDCYPARVSHSTFNSNGASGYYGYSSFASPGTGGAIYVKFSAAELRHNVFNENWVSAGGNEASIGGAVAVFFEYSSVSKLVVGVVISHSQFINNVAYGELCNVPNQAGQGGGLAVVGASHPAVNVLHCNFTNNLAMTASKRTSSYAKSDSVSLGGALSIALSSNVTIEKCFFDDNLAYNGAGNDVSSISGQSNQENFVHATDCTFSAGTKVSQTYLVQEAAQDTVLICKTMLAYFQQAKSLVIDGGTQSVHHSLRAMTSATSVDSADVSATTTTTTTTTRPSAPVPQGLPSFFSVPEHWHPHLTFQEGGGSSSPSLTRRGAVLHTEAEEEEEVESSVYAQLAEASKQARWNYLQSRDSSLLALPGARKRVSRIVNQILSLDIWKDAQQRQEGEGVTNRRQHSHTIAVDVTQAEARRLSPSVDQQQALMTGFVGRRSGMRAELLSEAQRNSSRVASMGSLQLLEAGYRALLYSELDAEFARLAKEQAAADAELHGETSTPIAFSSYTTSSNGKSVSAEGEGTTTLLPSVPTDALLNFHPYVVITSGRAYFENPTFKGVYHMFFGDFPQIAQYTYSDNYITNAIKAVPSDSAIFGHITQEDLTLSAITATIEIFDSNDDQDYSIRQVNLFNATLQLNRNVTVTGGSFVTGSLITAVSETSQSLIPYLQGGDEHPYVTFSERVYTGVSLESIFSVFGSVLNRNNDAAPLNVTEQTVVTVYSCTLVIDGALVSDSATENRGSFDLIDIPTRLSTNARYVLGADAKIEISPAGTFALLTETYIEAESASSPAVVNLGKVELLGRTKAANYSYGGKLSVSPFAEAARVGSLASRLVVFGDFVQAVSGSTTVYLNRTQQSAPVVFLINSANYSGSVFVDFYSNANDNIFPDLLLYDGVPSAWSVIAFRDRFSARSLLSFDQLLVHPQSPGLLFGQNTQILPLNVPDQIARADAAFVSPHHQQKQRTDGLDYVASLSLVEEAPRAEVTAALDYVFPNVTSLYTWGLEIENIGCPQINDYYMGVPQQDMLQASAPNAYACYVCLRNSSCNLCNGANGAAAGVCAVAGSCGAAGVAYGDSCCDGGCNGMYGSCKVNSEHTSFHCDCGRTIWYTGNNCKDLSASAYVVIFTCVSFVLTLLVMGFFYRRSKQQKQEVLDELADGLLNHNNQDGNNGFIQYMQQALILNDVFVKWEEITLESIVGEGSFGVVHKATFRGAQVAVKQMRSMFMELTDKEIDEFRKEAYVMSRLRHPNIVLVMGISLVDQEPVALPKSRSQNMSVEGPYDSANPMISTDSGNSAKKAKPQKTVCIITEFLEQGSLADILYGPTKLPAEIWTYELVLTCALQAARGMLYLHSHSPPICHRDLKSSNLVVDDHWVVKVTDFGMSRIVPENVQDRDKGIVPNSASSAPQASSYTLGTRKFSTSASPAGRKFSLGGWGQSSTPVTTTPTVESHKQIAASSMNNPLPLTPEEEAAKIEAEDAGERPSLASLDSMNDAGLPPGAEAGGTGSISSRNRKSSFVKNPNASRLSTFNPEMTSNLGTTAWCAPEVLVSGQKTRYTVKVDVYSFGLVLWELWEKKRPFEELTSRFDIMDAVRAGKRPEISANCPPSFRSLIQRCWQAEPSRRPMFKYIVRYLKDELARVKRQKGGAVYNSDPRASGNNRTYGEDFSSSNKSNKSRLTSFNIGHGPEGGEPERRSGSNFSQAGVGGVAGGIADAAEAAAEFFRKSFSFNARNSFNAHHQASSPASNHRPWMARASGADKDRDTLSDRESEGSYNNPAIVALQAAARSRPSDGTPRGSDGTAGTGGTGSTAGGRQSEVSGGSRPSENVPVKIPEGRSPLVSAVQSERSLSYLTESPSPFSQLAAINKQHNRVAGTAGAMPPVSPAPAPGPTPTRVNPLASNNRWRDRYVLQFSGWQSSNPDAGLPPSMTSSPAPTTPGSGLPPSRSVQSLPLQPSADPAARSNNNHSHRAPSADITIIPAGRGGIPVSTAAPAGNNGNNGSVQLARSHHSNASSAASSPKPPQDKNLAGATEEIFQLDEEQSL